MSENESPRETPQDNLDEYLTHCFKQYKLRDTSPHFFFKVKANRFGPPKSRRRIIIAPPMGEGYPPRFQPKPPEPSGEKLTVCGLRKQPEEEAKGPSAEDDVVQELEDWTGERRKLRVLLDSCVNIDKWLKGKQAISAQEESVLRKKKERREAQKIEIEAKLTATSSIEHLMPKRDLGVKTIPLINAPYPESLMMLHNLLHKQKLKLVELFNKVDRTKTMKFRRGDFIKIIQGTKVPISNSDLEDVIIYLTSSKKGNYITNEDLVECQKIWLDTMRDQWKQTKEAKPEETAGGQKRCQRVPSRTVNRIPSSYSKTKAAIPRVASKPKVAFLEVPPINTEPDCMHLTYNQMEIVGKRYKETRRRLKRQCNPLDWAERCRMVRSGNQVVDNHCLPSTIDGEMGELVNQHRLATHLVFIESLKLCEEYGIPLTETLLQRALLYPGDKIIKDDGNLLKLRQPGGYYSSDSSDQKTKTVKEEHRKSPSKAKKKRMIETKVKHHQQKETKELNTRWKSFAEFKNMMKKNSKKLKLPSPEEWTIESDSDLFMTRQSYELLYAKRMIEREMRRMFTFLNPKTDANSFWPGHLLDKLRLYLPHAKREEGQAVFSHISCARPAYPGMYHPHRTWPISEQRYVTYGDTDFRKYNYYI